MLRLQSVLPVASHGIGSLVLSRSRPASRYETTFGSKTSFDDAIAPALAGSRIPAFPIECVASFAFVLALLLPSQFRSYTSGANADKRRMHHTHTNLRLCCVLSRKK